MDDPMERMVAAALSSAGIHYATDFGGGNQTGLDFYLPEYDVHIEVKRFHSDRVAGQMKRAPNVVVAQGEVAIRWLADLIERGGMSLRPDGWTPLIRSGEGDPAVTTDYHPAAKPKST